VRGAGRERGAGAGGGRPDVKFRSQSELNELGTPVTSFERTSVVLSATNGTVGAAMTMALSTAAHAFRRASPVVGRAAWTALLTVGSLR
jgi:hypothetical protein